MAWLRTSTVLVSTLLFRLSDGQVFTSRTAWQDAVRAAGLSSFTEAFNSNVPSAQTITFPSTAITSTNSVPPNLPTVPADLQNSVANGVYNNIVGGANSALVSWLFPGGVRAFGADFAAAGVVPISLTATTDGGVQDATLLTAINGIPRFWGVIGATTAPILNIRSSDGTQVSWIADNVVFAVNPSPSPPRPSPLTGILCSTAQALMVSANWPNTVTTTQITNFLQSSPGATCSFTIAGGPAASFFYLVNPVVPVALPAPGTTTRGESSIATITDAGGAPYLLATCTAPNPASSAYNAFQVTPGSYATNAALYYICNIVRYNAQYQQFTGPLRMQMNSQYNLDRATVFRGTAPTGVLLTSLGGTFGLTSLVGSGRIYDYFLSNAGPLVAGVYYADEVSPAASPIPIVSPRQSPIQSPTESITIIEKGTDGSNEAMLGTLGLLGLPFCLLWLCYLPCCLYFCFKLLTLKKCSDVCGGGCGGAAMQPMSVMHETPEMYYVDSQPILGSGTPTYMVQPSCPGFY